MQTPHISVTPLNGLYCVQVTGRFGGGYTCPGQTAEQAAAMVIRDTPRYDCGSEPIHVFLAPAVRNVIELWRYNIVGEWSDQ